MRIFETKKATNKGNKSTNKTAVTDKNKEKKKIISSVYPTDVKNTEKENIFPIDIEKEELPEKIETKPKFVYKKLVDKKLYVILVENTSEMAEEKEMVMKIIKSLAPSGLITIINYGKTVKTSEIFDATTVYDGDFLDSKDIGNESCLYDALDRLELLVSGSYMKIEEKETERVRINEIHIIGIGNCKENGSKISKEVALKYFKRVVNKKNVTTKYFCLSENSFVNAAEVGFHSIGAIYRKY